ncbi:MAG: hypothetical protein IMZ50_03960 [Candidatus Atribacteria bacterium]|nr:hypothetical protein [Candidatus Atribacteria bacterium]
MPDTKPNVRAREVIDLYARELQDQQPFRNRWQQSSDMVLPRMNRITNAASPGEDKSLLVYDDTAGNGAREMAAGLSSSTVQTGQKFFDIGLRDAQLAELPTADPALWKLVEGVHYELFTSNFVSRYNQMLSPLGVLGQGCLYLDLSKKLKLSFRAIDIGDYVFLENSDGEIDVVIVSFTLTARQAVQNYGEDKLPKNIQEAASKLDKSSDKFKFLQIVRPRSKRNPNKKTQANMPFESLHIAVDAQQIVRESGYHHMPFIIFRWIISSGEKYGRGQGTENLASIKVLNRLIRDYMDIANRWAHPPYEKHQNFEGDVDLRPDGENVVMEMGQIKAIDQRMLGNMPITEKAVEMFTERVNRIFFVDVFRGLSNLTGDRRTTLEIAERLREGMKRISPMAAQLYEDMNKIIERAIDLLARNGLVEIPPELGGAEWSIEYLGSLALALKDKEAAGFLRFSQFVVNVAAVKPEALDTLNFDEALPDMARSMGVKSTHIATQERIDEIRAERAKQMQAQQELEAAEVAGKSYKNTSGSPEAGSPAAELMGAER